MKIKNIFKIIIFILLSSLILISLTGFSKLEETKTVSNSKIDTSYDSILLSINNILERNEKYENIDTKIKNLKANSYPYTLNVFGRANNDRQLIKEQDERLSRVARHVNRHKINFHNVDFLSTF